MVHSFGKCAIYGAATVTVDDNNNLVILYLKFCFIYWVPFL